MAAEPDSPTTELEDAERPAGPDSEPDVGREEAPEEDFKETLKKVLDVQVDDAGVLRKRLTITIPRETIDAEREKQYGEMIREVIVPGFRRGRAPRRLVEKRFGEEVGEQIRAKLVTNGYLAAADLKGLKTVGDPLIWSRDGDEEKLADVQTALSRLILPDEGPLIFRCEVEVWPDFELPELKDIAVKRPRVTISDEDVAKQIDRLRGLRGTWEPVADGAVQDDDMLVASVEMKVGTEPAVTAENVRLFARAQVIEGVTLESLGEALRGARAGDVRTVRAAVPEDHERVDWRGQEAQCALTIHEIKRYRMPPLDEAFVRSSGFDSEAELRQFVRAQMEADLSRVIRRGMRGQVSRYLIDQTRLNLPAGLSQRHAERAAMRRRIELRRQGVPQAEIEKHADELLTRASREAIDGLKLHFILEKASEQLKVEVTEEEINSQIAAIARQYNRRFDRVRDELAAGDGLSVLYAEVRDEKCLDRLLQDARIEETAGPGDAAPPKVEGT